MRLPARHARVQYLDRQAMGAEFALEDVGERRLEVDLVSNRERVSKRRCQRRCPGNRRDQRQQ